MALVSNFEAINVAQRIMDVIASEAEVAQLITDRDPRVNGLNIFNRQNIIRTQLVAHTWRKIGRKVLAIHPEVVDEVRVASSDKVPGEVLRTLPYMNPLVVFPDPPVFKTWMRPGQTHPVTGGKSETAMRLIGFFTFGTAEVKVLDTERPRAEQRIYSTNAPEADRFGIMLILETLDASGKVLDVELNSMSVFFAQTQTLAETVDDLMTRFHWDDPSVRDDPRSRKWVRDVMSVVIGSLFYLCSTTLEAEFVPVKTVRKLSRGNPRRPISLYRVGWTTGAALTRLRQQRLAGWKDSEQQDIGHEQDPQHRRSHFKMQPYGPHNSLRKLIFVSAYWTHLERLGEMGMNMAHAVPSLGKGETRQSVRTALKGQFDG